MKTTEENNGNLKESGSIMKTKICTKCKEK